jgi:hypothetical protein
MVGSAALKTPRPLAIGAETPMTRETVVQALRDELAQRTNQAARAAELLRSAADRLDAGSDEETRTDEAQRVRGAAVLAHTAALELAATSGWLDALAMVEDDADEDADG